MDGNDGVRVAVAATSRIHLGVDWEESPATSPVHALTVALTRPSALPAGERPDQAAHRRVKGRIAGSGDDVDQLDRRAVLATMLHRPTHGRPIRHVEEVADVDLQANCYLI